MKNFLKSFTVFIIISILVAYSNISMATNMNDLKNEKSSIQNKITSITLNFSDFKSILFTKFFF